MTDCDDDPRARARVEFSIRDDESAIRVEALLGSLGYDPVRDLANIEGDLFEEVTAAMAWRHCLPDRRAEILGLMLRGRGRAQIAEELGLELSTIKWELHKIYEAVGVSSSEEVLRLALRLDAGGRWLRAPLRLRELIEQFELTGSELLAALRGDSPSRVRHASEELEAALVRARELTNL